ncbi:hypothetical protein K493DRAFT_317290 [Basidiobolus meristosporus CBS 931.73]|uniref:Arrestin C-terminal-like domain-containing protein n=1 Tax=Basidiobolus meristosporus CBS 931.73 TaxID=1314790 RepID=A0A1Y1Y135_9FUNG|nr:hypothetical protein K493DRAFT_317290 [Basidiobolus meristosporus CBS 931.73]|eukprot:ORX91426.1 hypothetical protein K493DRAFT_317290 [Basidiobolus meristosporus CBS 931.73]
MTDKKIRLDIFPSQDPFILPDSSVPGSTTLRGKVALQLEKPTKLCSLSLHLKGHAELVNANWKPQSFKHLSRQKLTEVCVNFFKSNKDSYMLTAGTHMFDFELPISNHLPESVHSNYFDIKYKLVVMAKRHLSTNVIATKPLTISRVSEDSDEVEPSISISKIWDHVMGYDIFMKKQVSLGEIVPIEYTFRPVRCGIKIDKYSHTLCETVRYVDPKTNHTKVEHKRIPLACNPSNGHSNTKLVHLNMPMNLQPDVNSDMICAKHKLEVKIYVECRGQKKSITVSFPVSFMNEHELLLAEPLPRYEETEYSRSLPPSYQNTQSTA